MSSPTKRQANSSGGRRSAKTRIKNAHYQAMLKACVKNQMPFLYVLNDVWFAAADNMKLIKTDLGKDFVMPLKCNSNAIAKSPFQARTRKTDAIRQLKRLHSNTGKHGKCIWNRCLSHFYWSSKSSRTKIFTNKDASQGLLSLVTSDTALDGGQMMGLCQEIRDQERWRVEVYHKSLK